MTHPIWSTLLKLAPHCFLWILTDNVYPQPQQLLVLEQQITFSQNISWTPSCTLYTRTREASSSPASPPLLTPVRPSSLPYVWKTPTGSNLPKLTPDSRFVQAPRQSHHLSTYTAFPIHNKGTIIFSPWNYGHPSKVFIYRTPVGLSPHWKECQLPERRTFSAFSVSLSQVWESGLTSW